VLNAGIRLALLLSIVPSPLWGQGFLEEFSYEGLRFSGIGADAGVVFSNSLTTEAVGGIRVDVGTFSPKVRVVFGGLYFKGQFKEDRVQEFEQRLEDLVGEPVDIGTISLADIELYLDLQYLLPRLGRLQSYLSLGFGAHVRNGNGEAIEGTFVEDALSTVAAGLSGSVGFDIVLVPQLSFMAEARGGLTSELRTLSVRGGFMYRLHRGGPSE
jgi:hypothetical protein